MLGASQAVLLGAAAARPGSYDARVDSLEGVVSYWKFQNNGTDEKDPSHTTDAIITGSPELHVDTIVKDDTGGECVAWPGVSGNYAEVPHNAKHKTAQGTIVVTFQHDHLSSKSTLVAADRSNGGTASGPGGLSMEVTPEGAPRCFLRRQPDGAVVELVGAAGDVQVGQAYSLIFKWGPGGLAMTLWNASGNLVGRKTDPLENGVTGTSPIRFGAWHTGVSPHDGPYGRIVWLNRRLSDAGEIVLARARTITGRTTGSYTPFPFVTISNPAVDHTGVTDRPGYSPTDPRGASVIDPMSGIELFRVGGDLGATVFLNGTQNSGLKFPRKLMTENLGIMQKVWNADSTLLMVDRYFSRSGDPSNPCTSYIVDVTGAYSNGPWRIIRASNKGGLGDGVGSFWVWDPNNPLRAYVFRDNGSVDEWWPVGGAGHSVGEVNNLFGSVSGYSNWATSTRARAHTSQDGRYVMTGCRRTSDGVYGGRRRDLMTGALGPFVSAADAAAHIPFWMTNPSIVTSDSDTCANGISSSGQYTLFSSNQDYAFFDATTGGFVSAIGGGFGHPDWVRVDGTDYITGPTGSGYRMYDIAAGAAVLKSSSPGVNPSHATCRNLTDLFETYGGAGGSTTGNRYAVYVRSNSQSGHPPAILGVRLGTNDVDQIRYLCNHRSHKTDNSNECHAVVSFNGRYLAFNSNWQQANALLSDDVHPYVVSVPDAWYSPNNDGS
jgi:hypothetical protein